METLPTNIPAILERFIVDVNRIVAENGSRARTIEKIKPHFAELLADKTFLDEAYKKVIPHKFAQYAIYRATDRSLSIMSMVVPPKETTPVHDHLAWGLVGVYQGVQKETIYRRLDNGAKPGFAELEEVGTRLLNPGDITTLIPPDGDIHKIETISQEASISIHVLGNDIGCERRHAYHPEHKLVRPFRSGYQNVSCLDVRFDHQHLIVENVLETVAFYEEIFGARKIEETAEAGVPVVRLELNSMRLAISRQTIPHIGSHYGLVVGDLEAAIDELKSRGVTLLTELPGAQSVFMADLEGNVVELVPQEEI